MIVQYAPLVSEARGRFAGLVASAWRGVSVIRRYRKPANPKTADQMKVRRIFQNATRAFVLQNTETRNAWVAFAEGKDFTGRNSYIAKQVPALNDQTTLEFFVGTPGDASTLTPYTPVPTPGDGQLVVAVSTRPPPTGWTLTKVVCYCLQSTDWSGAPKIVDQVEGEDETSPYEITLTGLVNDQLYRVLAFCVWVEPGGETRYSLSSSADGTPSAA